MNGLVFVFLVVDNADRKNPLEIFSEETPLFPLFIGGIGIDDAAGVSWEDFFFRHLFAVKIYIPSSL